MNKLFVYLCSHLMRNAKIFIMKMIKKYWWLIALAALAYWKWDEIKAMFGKKDWSDSANPSGEVPTGTPLYTGDEAHSILPELNQDVNGDGVPDYLQGL